MSEQQIRKILAQKLHEHRLACGLTCKDVGAAIGKSEKTISAWENERGQPDADTLFELCKLYGIQSIAEFYPPAETAGQDEPTLTHDEVELLDLYRALNPQSRELALSMIRGLAGNPAMTEEKLLKSAT